MGMFNRHVRDMLNIMIEWHIGVQTGFTVSAGKMGKFFKKYLPPEHYTLYTKTYSDAAYENFWTAVFTSCDLFRSAALAVAKTFGYTYNKQNDVNMMIYLLRMKNDEL
jgi:aminoglycoside 6-adenylyltransferase